MAAFARPVRSIASSAKTNSTIQPAAVMTTVPNHLRLGINLSMRRLALALWFICLHIVPFLTVAQAQSQSLIEWFESGPGMVLVDGAGVLSSVNERGETVDFPFAWSAVFANERMVGRLRTGDSIEAFRLAGLDWEEYGIVAGDRPFLQQRGWGPPDLSHPAIAAMPGSEFYFFLDAAKLNSYARKEGTSGVSAMEWRKDSGGGGTILRFQLDGDCISGFQRIEVVDGAEFPLSSTVYTPPICTIPWKGVLETVVYSMPGQYMYRELTRLSVELRITQSSDFERDFDDATAEYFSGTMNVPPGHRYVHQLKTVMSDIDWNEWMRAQILKRKTDSGLNPPLSENRPQPTDHLPVGVGLPLKASGSVLLVLAALMLMFGRKK